MINIFLQIICSESNNKYDCQYITNQTFNEIKKINDIPTQINKDFKLLIKNKKYIISYYQFNPYVIKLKDKCLLLISSNITNINIFIEDKMYPIEIKKVILTEDFTYLFVSQIYDNNDQIEEEKSQSNIVKYINNTFQQCLSQMKQFITTNFTKIPELNLKFESVDLQYNNKFFIQLRGENKIKLLLNPINKSITSTEKIIPTILELHQTSECIKCIIINNKNNTFEIVTMCTIIRYLPKIIQDRIKKQNKELCIKSLSKNYCLTITDSEFIAIHISHYFKLLELNDILNYDIDEIIEQKTITKSHNGINDTISIIPTYYSNIFEIIIKIDQNYIFLQNLDIFFLQQTKNNAQYIDKINNIFNIENSTETKNDYKKYVSVLFFYNNITWINDVIFCLDKIENKKDLFTFLSEN